MTRHPELALEWALEPQHLLDERRDEAAVVAEPLLQIRPLAEHLQREPEHAGRSSPARGEEVGRDERDVVDVGQGPVGERRPCAMLAHHVGARRAAAFLDVRRELPVEELQRLVLHRCTAADAHRVRGQLLCGTRVVGLRHAEQVGDDEQRERLGELADELARPVGDESRRPGGRPAAT